MEQLGTTEYPLRFIQIAVNSERNMLYALDQAGRIWFVTHRVTNEQDWQVLPAPSL